MKALKSILMRIAPKNLLASLLKKRRRIWMEGEIISLESAEPIATSYKEVKAE